MTIVSSANTRLSRKPQLERKLRSWKFCKNIPSKLWPIIGCRIKERAKKTLVILSGKRLPHEKVEYEVKRHTPLTLIPGQY